MEQCSRRENESIVEYKERLYKNRRLYNLSWEDVNSLLDKNHHPDNTRKASYGYLECLEDMKENEKFEHSVMIINDVHTPFERGDVLEIIAKHADEITTLVIGGDLMDCYEVSSFPKINRDDFMSEVIYGYNFLKKIRKILNNGQKIIIINGNHEERWKKVITKMNEKNMQKFINPNVLDMIVNGFTTYEGNKKNIFNPIPDIIHIPHWYVVIDRMIVAHPKDFSRVKGKMLENVTQHFINKNIDFDLVIFGHTHKISIGVIDRFEGKIAIENPCLCRPQEYSDIGKLGYSPQAYGYTIVKYNDKINFNNIKTYVLDEFEDNIKEYKINLKDIKG